ncbi:MAG: hypothetical protein IJM50_05740 [Lachnospiraceae bacterium]|nr:hypothetical protein [Lachnospiraceae bacterium]
MKSYGKWGIAFILIFLIVGFWWVEGGWNHALRSEGIRNNKKTVLFSEKDSSGTRTCVITDYGETDVPKVVKLVRERWKRWNVIGSGNKALAEQMIKGGKSYLPEHQLKVESVYHMYYCGNNAKTLIETLNDELPGGITASISQHGRQFLIHLFSYGEMNMLLTIEPEELLKQKGYIPNE